jgi:hypothetical protein
MQEGLNRETRGSVKWTFGDGCQTLAKSWNPLQDGGQRARGAHAEA